MEIANERLFDKWNIYYKFSYEQILSIIENECKFFEKVLDKKAIRCPKWSEPVFYDISKK